MTENKTAFDRLCSAEAKIEQLIFLAGEFSSEGFFSDLFSDFLDEQGREGIEEIFGETLEEIDFDDNGDLAQWMLENKKFGFLALFATPVNPGSGEWWYRNSTWVYADTMEEAIDKGIAWAEQRHKDRENTAD